MDIKNTTILLILLLSIIGLLVGISISDDASTNYSHNTKYEKVYEDKEGILTITLEKKDNEIINKYST